MSVLVARTSSPEGQAAVAAAGDLLEVARTEDVSAIVVDIKRRSPVGKLLLGPNAQEILLGASVPAIAVKAAGNA